MIVYDSTKYEFVNDVLNDRVDAKIYQKYREKIGKVNDGVKRSWRNSMEFMYKVLNTNIIPDNSGVAIEFSIPSSSKRIDFILTGYNEKRNESAIIIELKQWDYVEKVENKDGIVKTILNRGIHETTHPSYQAWSYASMIEDYNEAVQKYKIGLFPCVYLHNYDISDPDPLTDEMYKDHLEKAPVYAKGDLFKLRDFITRYVKYGDDKNILYKIENGKLKPSKSLQDSLLSMLKGNREFILIDEQKQVYEQAFDMAKKSHKDGRKRVLIVKGGPGTGKSVISINLLVNLTNQEMVCQYVSKNAAPRNVYSTKLKGSIRKTNIDNLFKGSGFYTESIKNEIDALIVDEAHRLNEKSGMFRNKGENQIKEIINAAKFSVFFIDENQRIDIHDIGSMDEIFKYAKKTNAIIDIMELTSQFRCNGSEGYIAWIDDVLQIRQTANFDGFNHDYDIQVIDDPNLLREMILEKNKINNKSRLLAGYCWDWEKKGRNNTETKDIFITDYNFSMSWNLDNTSTWAIDPDSVNEVGCIHTSQGLEFDYVGVIIGPDMKYENRKVMCDYNERAKTDNSLKGIKKLYQQNPGKALRIADEIIKNTYRTLLTRGQKGCYVFCVDKNLSYYLKSRLKNGQFMKNTTRNAAEESNKFET